MNKKTILIILMIILAILGTSWLYFNERYDCIEISEEDAKSMDTYHTGVFAGDKIVRENNKIYLCSE